MSTRSLNAIRNAFTGIAGRFVSIFLPFITRTAILYSLGSTYLGLGTLFSSVLSFLGLAELGIGSAIAFAMYKPIADNDINKICCFLGYIKKIYRRIGTIILLIGIFIIPLIPTLIKGEVPADISIYRLYILYLINTSIGYFFAGYRQVLLNAHQRMDVLNIELLVINIFVYLTQTAVVVLTKNYYAYAFIPIIGTLINNLCNLIITRRMFPEIECIDRIVEEDKYEIKKRIGGLFGTRLNSLVIHQADIIVISTFIGLEMVAVYGNYYYIMNAVCEVIMVLFTSMIAGIGNKMAMDSVDQNYSLFRMITVFNEWIVNIASACFICLYQPFMIVWVGDKLLLDFNFVILLTLYFFVYEIQRTILAFKDAAGIWREDQVRPYVSMALNLSLNIILVKFVGIYGIVLSTILAFTVSLPWANSVLFNNYFKIKPSINIKTIIKSFCTTCISCLIAYLSCMFFAINIVGILIRLVIAIVASNIVFIAVNNNRSEFITLKKYLYTLVKSKIIK